MKPKKYLAQHFLTAPYYAKRIADSVPAKADEYVLEIGSGTGALSVHLAASFSRLHCLEKDTDVMTRFRERMGIAPCVMHHGDVLEFDFSKVGFPLHVVGNLPYRIAAPIIKKTLFYGSNIRSVTFMVQREVAERICASPHTKRMGFLSILCRFFGKPSILFHVSPGSFFPKPKVGSSVFRLEVESDVESKLNPDQWNDFFKLVGKGFGMRRKKLVNALRAFDDTIDYSWLFSKIDLDTFLRAEDLTVNEWLRIFKATRQ